jgi:hypothetical protein
MGHTVVEQPHPDGTLGAVQSRYALTRRTVLGAAVLALVGCGKHTKPATPPPAADPDADALASAAAIEQVLLASYDARIAAASARVRPRLQVARAIHATHLGALHGSASTPAASTPAASTPPASTPAASVADIRRALRASVATLRRLALAAEEGANAALLASIAASHETSLR